MPKVALVTGGTFGIGREIATNLSADHEVVAVWRSTPPAILPERIHTIR